MDDNKHIEEANLDKALNNLFLETNSIEIDEDSVRLIMEQEYDIKINTTKEKQFLKKLNRKPNDPGRWNYPIIIIVIVIAGIGFLLINKQSYFDNNKPTENKNRPDQTMNNTKYDFPPLNEQSGLLMEKDPDSLISHSIETSTSVPQEVPIKNPAPYFSQSAIQKNTSNNSLFPFIADDLNKFNNIKNKMFEKLLKHERGMYSMVEEGVIGYRGNEVTIEPFILRNQAITNLEYKFFLADLIKKNRMDDYKKASVKNEIWTNYNHKILANTYFTEEMYNDFPVVNISMEAALLFCNWLEKEINAYSRSVDPKAKPLTIRLPQSAEWIFITRRGYAQIPNCDGYNTIYDLREGIVDKSYIKRINLIKKRGESKLTELDELFSTNRYGMNENQTLELFKRGSNFKSKLTPDSLYPNKMDVYSKAAHVSEMIQEQGTGKTLIVGACWKNKQECMKMVTEFNSASASPYIGFRVVVTNDSKASYKKPFW
ncbi:MAG: SUMF1/EgtB/PvdO family nonheme iron enzyme [Bacteroidota bacterium]